MTRLAGLRALLAKATPGPWHWWTSNSFRRLSSDATGKDGDVLWGYTCRDGVPDIEGRQEDMELIVAAVNALPALLDCVQALEKIAEDASYADSVAAAVLGQVAEEALAKITVTDVIGDDDGR